MPVVGSTPNFALALPYGNRQNWTDLANGNFRLLDALVATFVSVSNLKGLWTNNFAYVIGDNVTDETSGVIYTAQVNHTSSSAPTTFLEERTNHPTYWLTFSVAARQRGAWQTNTAYALNDFVLADGTKYAMAIQAHTSGATFAADLAAGKWQVMIDLSTAGSLVLPVLSGLGDGNKVVMSDSGGNSYIISSIAALLTLLLNAQGTTGSGSFALSMSPALTGNPTAPTQTAEDNDTSVSTTGYADNAVRSLVIRIQTWTAGGTYTPHTKMLYTILGAQAAGGGGAGVTNGAGQWYGGGGGGGGEFALTVASKATIGASQSVTIGSAGGGGAGGTNNGTAGGSSSIGSLAVANGGSGGVTATGALSSGAAGGTGGTGDILIAGKAGGHPMGIGSIGWYGRNGYGGGSAMGRGGAEQSSFGSAASGGAAGARGGGGAGGYTWDSGGVAAAGGAGGAGFAFALELCYG